MVVADDLVEQKGPIREQTELEEKLRTSTEVLGNADDFRTTERLFRRIYIDGELVNEGNKSKMGNSMLTVYRNDLLTIHSVADQLSFALNTAIDGNPFGGSEMSFSGETYRPEEMRDKFPYVELMGGHSLDRYSVLSLKKDGKVIPLVYLARGSNYPREDTPEDSRIDFSLYLGAMDGYKNLSDGEQQALTDFLVKFSQTGFTSLSELTGKDGIRYPNPIDDDGAFSPKKEYYKADPKAWDLRNELAEIAVMIDNGFQGRNEIGKVVSMMDQKAARIYGLISKEGIDLDNYKFPKGLEGYEPWNSAVDIAWNVLNSMYDITDLKANWMDLATGQLKENQDQEEDDETTVDFGESQAGLRKMSSLSEQEKKVLVAQSMINIMFHRLDINNDEADEIKMRLGIE